MGGQVIRYTVPVWVMVDETGRVVQVHVDDQELDLDRPEGFVPGEQIEAGWADEDVRPPTASTVQVSRGLRGQTWPGWEFGW